MRGIRSVLVGVFLLGTVVAAPQVGAVWKGQECFFFNGPDGDGGVDLNTCIVVDDHDFQDQIRSLSWNAAGTGSGSGPAEVHVSYMHLIKNGVVIKNTGSFTNVVNPNAPETFSTTWHHNPNGTYHTRIRMWVCWPSLAGDPCGSVVVWNSGNASY